MLIQGGSDHSKNGTFRDGLVRRIFLLGVLENLAQFLIGIALQGVEMILDHLQPGDFRLGIAEFAHLDPGGFGQIVEIKGLVVEGKAGHVVCNAVMISRCFCRDWLAVLADGSGPSVFGPSVCAF